MDIMERDPRATSESEPVVRFGPGGDFEKAFHADPHHPGRLTTVRVDDGRRDALIEKKQYLRALTRWLTRQGDKVASELIVVEGEIDAIDRGREGVAP
jgi:hypothetical protein